MKNEKMFVRIFVDGGITMLGTIIISNGFADLCTQKVTLDKADNMLNLYLLDETCLTIETAQNMVKDNEWKEI